MYEYNNPYIESYDMSQKGLAEAYIPIQKYVSAYPPEQGLMRGTIFPELDKPYVEEKMRRY
ncbi:spore coat associated protein CotJA [Thermoanaerobacterium sp. RBIITD]|uniref:spore coat associated protein CotJA n=1 Tax=Thermoanaerobacterium sp. RBIITD TaxID=1550240 RepID=UPI000BB89457|nr:spore coat associated protein CotJA [Thermoanaerobacterium sp. RBIITD]SNX54859.1 Spore coat associated protein JA (CotJA) [Thermoanaerobacterium sp. RBIITD]